ncbi:hypothetical protein BIV60_15220 [Bacillus sp. MUM 116]|uniref:hypothetical protein n=1 Tax=Bacillus sp. MUM 116 TaxID=1678002 RepID=UPI0008F5D4E8|nr:hypothetical protein [Bacillus sp. MUM 116]OIK13026.1 hypothetical protein BIV60_15220 [Bacillus sp. MUM 116]
MFSKIMNWFSGKDSNIEHDEVEKERDGKELDEEFEEDDAERKIDDDFVPERISILKEELK